MAKVDVIVIGGGHNGLVCAFYLARAGLAVHIVERRHIIGGTAVTEEFHPGYRASTASYSVGLLDPNVIADMRLHSHGMEILERPFSNFLPLDDRNYLKIGGGLAQTQQEFAKYSAKDAEVLPRYYESLGAVSEVMRYLSLKIPPNAGGGFGALVQAALQGKRVAALSLEQQRDLLDLFTKSASDFLGRWFESEPVKAAFGFDSVIGHFGSPEHPGSAYVLLHHVFGEVNGKKGVWGHARGGMSGITGAMERACIAEGVKISLECPVKAINVLGGRATGVTLENGGTIDAAIVVSNVGPRLLYGKLISPSELPADFLDRIRSFKVGSASFRMNLALSDLPEFRCLPGKGDHHRVGMVFAPSLDYMHRAYLDAKADGMSRRPIIDMVIPSTIDDSLAPKGQHVASIFAQHFSPELPSERQWDDEREIAADAIIDTIESFAPGFRSSIIARQIHSPLDLERKFGLVGGDIMHGNMSLDQLWAARPMLGFGAYRGPLEGLYMCGAGTHPGGGVSGAPGHNAARAVLADRPLVKRLLGR